MRGSYVQVAGHRHSKSDQGAQNLKSDHCLTEVGEKENGKRSEGLLGLERVDCRDDSQEALTTAARPTRSTTYVRQTYCGPSSLLLGLAANLRRKVASEQGRRYTRRANFEGQCRPLKVVVKQSFSSCQRKAQLSTPIAIKHYDSGLSP